MKRINIIFGIIIILTMCSFTEKNNCIACDSSFASSSDVIQTYNEMIAYCKGKNYDKNNFKIEKVNEKYVAAENMSQYFLNNNYNEKNPMRDSKGIVIKYTGTCSEVAATMANKFYAKSQYANGNATNYSVFESNIDYAVENEFFPVYTTTCYDSQYSTYLYHYEQYGTKYLKVKDIFENSLSEMGINYDIWVNDTNVVQGIKDFTNDSRGGKTQILGIQGHALLSAGYVDIEYSYTVQTGILWWKKTVTKYSTDTFIVVCDGWSNASADSNSWRSQKDICYSYIDSSKSFNYVIGIEIL